MHRPKQHYRTNTNLACNIQNNSGRNKLKAMALDCRCRAGKEAMRVGGDAYHDICLPHLAGCTFLVYFHNVIASALRDNTYQIATAPATIWKDIFYSNVIGYQLLILWYTGCLFPPFCCFLTLRTAALYFPLVTLPSTRAVSLPLSRELSASFPPIPSACILLSTS